MTRKLVTPGQILGYAKIGVEPWDAANEGAGI